MTTIGDRIYPEDLTGCTLQTLKRRLIAWKKLMDKVTKAERKLVFKQVHRIAKRIEQLELRTVDAEYYRNK